MTIKMITTGAPALMANGAAAGEGAVSADGAGFADILSLQLSDLGALLQAPMPTEDLQDQAAPGEQQTNVDPAALLAGLMAATPNNVPRDALPKGTAASSDAAVSDEQGTRGLAGLTTTVQDKSALAATTTGTGLGTDKAANPPTAGTPDLSANIAAPAQEGTHTGFAATLAAHTHAPSGVQRHADAPVQQSVATPLQDSRWSGDFGEKIVWLARNDQQSAQININPPQLGPVQITLNLSGDQATAFFVSPHAEVRQAIESALPQLRDMLAGAGIDLGQANVGAQFARQEQQQSPDSPRFSDDNAILSGDSGPTAGTANVVRHGRGMVDLFA